MPGNAAYFFTALSDTGFFLTNFAIAVWFLPDTLLFNRIADADERITRGTFYLVEKELEGLSYTQQQEVIKELQIHFKFPIYLLKPSDPSLNKKAWKLIMAGKIASPEIDGSDDYFKKMQSSDTIISINFSDSQSELDHKEAYGTFFGSFEF